MNRRAPTAGITPDGWVSIGVVARAHGIKGALRMHFWNEESDVLDAGLEVRVGTVAKRVARYASGILVLEGLDDRNAAEALQGQELFVRRDDFPEAEDDELYLVDVVGAAVVDESGASLGVVEGVTDNGAQPLLLVRHQGREVMVPFVDAIVREASPERVVLAPPGGLFDAADDNEKADDA